MGATSTAPDQRPLTVRYRHVGHVQNCKTRESQPKKAMGDGRWEVCNLRLTPGASFCQLGVSTCTRDMPPSPISTLSPTSPATRTFSSPPPRMHTKCDRVGDSG